MRLGTLARVSLWFALLVLSITSRGAFAQAPISGSTEQASPTSAPAVETAIRELLPPLLETDAGIQAVDKLSALREPQVILLFQRIMERALYTFDGKVVYSPENAIHSVDGVQMTAVYDLFVRPDAEGKLNDKPLAIIPEEELKKASFDVKPRVRTAAKNAVRVVGLKLKDPDARAAAARDLGNYRIVDALPDLRALLDAETDPIVRREASASIQMILASGNDASATPEQRLAAIERLGALKCLRSLDLLREISATTGTTPEMRHACGIAIKRIERHGLVTSWIQNCFSAVSAGSIYVMLALGLAITFGLMGVINMAHGEMMMIGAVTTWACFEFVGRNLSPAWFDWYYVIAFPASFIAAAAVGLLIECTIVRHLYKRPLDSMLATIGVSYILIQAVRMWKGDNLGMTKPVWSGGNWEVMQDVVLPYNRLFLIALTIFCIFSVIAIFRYTRIGLLIRATVQNREMAQALGVNTRLVDMFTFAFGAGLAGLAGYGLVLTTSPNPEMGQTFIVKSFLTVVVGGVGKLAGVVVSGLGLGFIEKLLEPITLITKPIRLFDATWSQVAGLAAVILFMQRRPAGLFPEKGRMADQADRTSTSFITKISPGGERMLGWTLTVIGIVVVPGMYLLGFTSLEFVNKLGYILTFAICAIGLDLVWGYIGVLSLCQFMFFAMGAYCMGLYLINHGPIVDGVPECLHYVMSDPNGGSPPWFLPLFKWFPGAFALGLVLPGLLALAIGLTTFRSRVRGVYFSILTQALTLMAGLIFQKNELKLGGTNGLAHFDTIIGYPIAAKAFPDRLVDESWIQHLMRYAPVAFCQTRFWLYIASCATMLTVLFLSRRLVNSGFGRTLMAIRDDETRLRFVGYQTWGYKTAAFTIAAVFAALGGMLYVPQKSIITPGDMTPIMSIMVVAWVAVGGRGSLWGAVLGAILVSLAYAFLTSWASSSWNFILGGMFILVPLLVPGGLVSIPKRLLRERRNSAMRPAFSVMPPAKTAEGSAT
jgi:urea transport system permease protein